MSVKIIAELNPFSRSRVELSVEAKPIEDILTQLNTGFPLSQARVCRNGEIVEDFSTRARDGDMLTVKFVPSGSNNNVGSLMKFGGWALAAVGGLLMLTGGGAAFGLALIGAGIGMISGGTVLMNLNIPPPPKDRESPESDPSVRGAKNQARPHGRIPVLFGRHRIYPDLAANAHTEIIGNQQYFTQLFCGGYKDCVIDVNSFKLGETPLINFSNTKNISQILSGADTVVRLEVLQNGEASNLYPCPVHEDTLNAPLQNLTVDENGNKISGEIERRTPDGTTGINVDIFLMNGIGKYKNDGGIEDASVVVQALYKPAESSSAYYVLLGSFGTISGAELKTKRFQITKNDLPPGRYDVKIVRVTPDSTDNKIIDQVHVGSIRARKAVDSNGLPVRPIRQQRQQELTVIALRVMATAKLNGVIDSFNYIATSKLPVHLGSGSGAIYWLTSAATRNPAAMLLYALRGRATQQQVDPGDIDWPSLEAFYDWCANRGYTCDAYLSESVTIAELLRMIGGTSRADILRIDSKISVVQDIERPAHMQLFTPKNTISYSVAMFSADIPDSIALRFIDEDSGYAQNEVQVFNTRDGNREEEPDTTQKIDLWGVVNSAQARRIGMYNYGCLKNRPFVHTIEADIEYLVVNKGDWIQYAGDIALAGSTQGRIKGLIFSDGVCIGIDTDEPIVMESGKQYAVRIRRSDGTIILKDVVFSLGALREKSITYFPGEDKELYEPYIGDMYAVDENNVYYEPENVIYFIEPFNKAAAPKVGDIYAFGVRGYEALDLIITDIKPGQNFTAVLTCVEYSPEIFGVDDPDFELPEFVNRITPVSGAVDSGVVNPDNWRSFATYHDNEYEPLRPTGDGQDGGWHHLETFRSLWKSTKLAESIESGEWSLPVRIKAQRGSDDVTPIWLSLSPQNLTLDTDDNGKTLPPEEVQARLFQWNSLLKEVVYSLVGAPTGVTINSNGLITIAAGAALQNENNISVKAEYQNIVYEATLIVKKNTVIQTPRYLGLAETLAAVNDNKVTITKGSLGQVSALRGDYALIVAALNNHAGGSVWQWTGVAWEYRAPENYSELYIRCFKDGLDVPTLKNDIGWFGGVFASLLAAQKGFIEELAASIITMRNPGIIMTEEFQGADGAKPGYFLRAEDGKIEANNIKTKNLHADSGVFTNGNFEGTITATSATLSGNLIASQGNFLGGSFSNITLKGTVFLGHPFDNDKVTFLVHRPLYRGALLRGNYTTVQFISELNNYFSDDFKLACTYFSYEFKCSGIVSLLDQPQQANGANLLALLIAWTNDATRWIIRGARLSGIIGDTVDLDLSTLSNRNFRLNLLLCC